MGLVGRLWPAGQENASAAFPESTRASQDPTPIIKGPPDAPLGLFPSGAGLMSSLRDADVMFAAIAMAGAPAGPRSCCIVQEIACRSRPT
jgi:hypothetical protein